MQDASDSVTNNANELAILIGSLQLQLKSKDQTIALLIEQVRILKHQHFGRAWQSRSGSASTSAEN